MNPERITQSPGSHEQLLYFTSSSILADDSRIVFISDRTGHPNLFLRDLRSGEERQLSHNTEGILKSYVYFLGTPYRGFGKASVSLHAESGTVYYIQGREIRKVTADGLERTLASYPEGQMTAFTHVSTDGKFLCVPTVDARTLDGDRQLSGSLEYAIDERVQAEGLSSYLRVYDTETGEQVRCERVEKGWVTHVQFAPHDSNVILYNHEYVVAECGVRRMWLFDGKKHTRLRTLGEGRQLADWVCHEMWERDGSAIIYHGKHHEGCSFIGRVRPDGTGLVEIPLPAHYKRYGHFTVGSPGVLISDGYYEEPGDKPTRGGDWISRLDVNWAQGEARWSPLCRNSSSWDSQDSHPHPIIDHGMTHAYFTSDKEGKRAIYRIKIS